MELGLTDSDGDAKKLKTSSDSDTPGAETLQKIHAEAQLSSMQDMSPAGPAKAPAPSSKAATPVTPPKASPARPKTPPKAGPPRLAGTPITDREVAVDFLEFFELKSKNSKFGAWKNLEFLEFSEF